MLPALRRLARREPPAPIPPDTLDPRQPKIRAASDERALIRLASLDPHGARILGLAYDDPITLDGREYAYKVCGLWRGAEHVLDLRNLAPARIARVLERAGAQAELSRGGPEIVIRFPRGAVDFVLEAEPHPPLDWEAEDDQGGRTSGTFGGRSRQRLSLARVAWLTLRWPGTAAPALGRAAWHEVEQRTGLLPSVFAREPGPPSGPTSITADVRLPDSPSGIARAHLDWPLPLASDGTVSEGAVVAYQVGHRHLAADPSAPAPVPGAAAYADLLRPPAPIYISLGPFGGSQPLARGQPRRQRPGRVLGAAAGADRAR
jgi:hypothetical protein